LIITPLCNRIRHSQGKILAQLFQYVTRKVKFASWAIGAATPLFMRPQPVPGQAFSTGRGRQPATMLISHLLFPSSLYNSHLKLHKFYADRWEASNQIIIYIKEK
jgi:hypothetical protein